MTFGPDGHLGDLVSGLLDGELGPADAAAARAHLGSCPECRHGHDVAVHARALVRALPPVEPPFGFFERMVLARPRVARRSALAGIAAGAAAAAAVVALASPGARPVHPRVANLVQTHAATASVAGDPVSQLAPAGVPVRFEESP